MRAELMQYATAVYITPHPLQIIKVMGVGVTQQQASILVNDIYHTLTKLFSWPVNVSYLLLIAV